MYIDGRKIAEIVYARVHDDVVKMERQPVFGILVCAPNFETQKYLALKQKKAEAVGIHTNVYELSAESTTEDFCAHIDHATTVCDALIVQLPLPTHVDRDRVFAHIPTSHDADALNPATTHMLSPVVLAIHTILAHHHVGIEGKRVTIIGSGKLVGLPAFTWFTRAGAHVSLVTKDTEDISSYTKHADIVVCGAGVPKLIAPDMVSEGVIILDAGTSEDGGELRGDADPACAEKALLFTPVPGGVGPLTIACLLENVARCASRHNSVV